MLHICNMSPRVVKGFEQNNLMTEFGLEFRSSDSRMFSPKSQYLCLEEHSRFCTGMILKVCALCVKERVST